MSDEAIFESSRAAEIDPTSIPVTLSSVGKLSFPRMIRVRDYGLDDSLLLSTLTGDTIVGDLVQVLGHIIQGEDIDPQFLHESEMEEILLTVYANFWQGIMEFPYLPTREERATMEPTMLEALERGDFSPKIEVNLRELKTKTLPENFCEPFSVVRDKRKYSFRLPRIGDYINADKETLRKFAVQEKNFQEIENQLEYNEEMKKLDHKKMIPIDPDLFRQYTEYLKAKARFMLKAKQAHMLVAIDDKPLDTLQFKMDARVPLKLWTDIVAYIEKDLSFGVVRDLTIASPISGKEMSWRAPFRFVDFIPSSDVSNSAGFAVQFGS